MDDRLKLKSCYPICVKNSLVVVSVGTPNTITRYDGLKNMAMLRTTALQPMENEQEIWMFGLTAFRNRFVLFTGGWHKLSENRSPLVGVYVLDSVSGQWLSDPV